MCGRRPQSCHLLAAESTLYPQDFRRAHRPWSYRVGISRMRWHQKSYHQPVAKRWWWTRHRSSLLAFPSKSSNWTLKLEIHLRYLLGDLRGLSLRGAVWFLLTEETLSLLRFCLILGEEDGGAPAKRCSKTVWYIRFQEPLCWCGRKEVIILRLLML